MKWTLFVFLLFPVLAFAQADTTAPQPNRMNPVSVGQHDCAAYLQEGNYHAFNSSLPESNSVLLSFQIDTDGSVKDIKIKRSNTDTFLNNLAMKCASEWQYRPATVNGQPVSTPWSAMVSWNDNPQPGKVDTRHLMFFIDIAASGKARQTCMTTTPDYIDRQWTYYRAIANMNRRESNEEFTCIGKEDIGQRICLAKPASHFYPGIIVTTVLVSGNWADAWVNLDTALHCDAIPALDFENGTPHSAAN